MEKNRYIFSAAMTRPKVTAILKILKGITSGHKQAAITSGPKTSYLLLEDGYF